MKRACYYLTFLVLPQPSFTPIKSLSPLETKMSVLHFVETGML